MTAPTEDRQSDAGAIPASPADGLGEREQMRAVLDVRGEQGAAEEHPGGDRDHHRGDPGQVEARSMPTCGVTATSAAATHGMAITASAAMTVMNPAAVNQAVRCLRHVNHIIGQHPFAGRRISSSNVGFSVVHAGEGCSPPRVSAVT